MNLFLLILEMIQESSAGNVEGAAHLAIYPMKGNRVTLDSDCSLVVRDHYAMTIQGVTVAKLETNITELDTARLIALAEGVAQFCGSCPAQQGLVGLLRRGLRHRVGMVLQGKPLSSALNGVSYAAWWKRNGASDEKVARLIGDKSVRMGAHYTRHVEDEVSITRAFSR